MRNGIDKLKNYTKDLRVRVPVFNFISFSNILPTKMSVLVSNCFFSKNWNPDEIYVSASSEFRQGNYYILRKDLWKLCHLELLAKSFTRQIESIAPLAQNGVLKKYPLNDTCLMQ